MMPWMTQDVENEPNYPRYWFGAVDNSQTPAAIVFKDGFLAPYLETDERVFRDPDFGPDNVTETRYNTFTTSYAYNTVLGPGTSLKYDASYNVVGVWPPGYTIQAGDDPSGTYPVGTIIPPVGRELRQREAHGPHDRFRRQRHRAGPDVRRKIGLTENWYLDSSQSRRERLRRPDRSLSALWPDRQRLLCRRARRAGALHQAAGNLVEFLRDATARSDRRLGGWHNLVRPTEARLLWVRQFGVQSQRRSQRQQVTIPCTCYEPLRNDSVGSSSVQNASEGNFPMQSPADDRGSGFDEHRRAAPATPSVGDDAASRSGKLNGRPIAEAEWAVSLLATARASSMKTCFQKMRGGSTLPSRSYRNPRRRLPRCSTTASTTFAGQRGTSRLLNWPRGSPRETILRPDFDRCSPGNLDADSTVRASSNASGSSRRCRKTQQ